MKYTPIMEKLDLPAKEELLRWDPKALILSEEKAFRQRVIEVFWRAEADESQVILLRPHLLRQDHRLPHPGGGADPQRQPGGPHLPGRFLQGPGGRPPVGGWTEEL